MEILLWLVALALIAAGLAGTVLPALPGTPLIFAGMFAIAVYGGFTPVGRWTLAVLGMLTLLSLAIDWLASGFGARRAGASPRAFWGATIGALAGLFFGLPGIVLGPFLGALAAEIGAGRTLGDAGRAGLGAWLGLALGSAAKIAIAFTMIGIFAWRYLVA